MLEVRSEESARRLEEKLPPALRLHSVQEVARILKTAHEDLIMLKSFLLSFVRGILKWKERRHASGP